MAEDACLCEGEYTCELCEGLDEEYIRDLYAAGCDDYDYDWLRRERLYEWEHATFELVRTSNDMSLDECQRLVNERFRRYRGSDDAPLVGPAQRTNRACLDDVPRPGTTLSRIWLPKWARNKVMVLHETAHAIAHGDGHGPLFARVYIELLAAEGFGEIDDLVASAGAAGVKVGER